MGDHDKNGDDMEDKDEKSRRNHKLPLVLDAKKSIINQCICDVRVRSTGLVGGNSSHGGRTSIQLGWSGGDWSIKTCTEEGLVQYAVYGDAELRNLVAALKFALDCLAPFVNERHPE